MGSYLRLPYDPAVGLVLKILKILIEGRYDWIIAVDLQGYIQKYT